MTMRRGEFLPQSAIHAILPGKSSFMPKIHSLIEKIRTMRPLYLQILFVALAFAAMVASSSLYVNNMLRGHLRRDATDLLAQTKLKIEAELLEPETALAVIANTIREMILHGYNADMIQQYVHSTAETLERKSKGFKFSAFFGHFDAFGGKYITSVPRSAMETVQDFDPMTRPWYTAAIAAGDWGRITAAASGYMKEVCG